MELTTEQNAELSRLKAHFPYRVVWGAIHPETHEWVASANTSKRQMNSYVRKGWTVFQVA